MSLLFPFHLYLIILVLLLCEHRMSVLGTAVSVYEGEKNGDGESTGVF